LINRLNKQPITVKKDWALPPQAALLRDIAIKMIPPIAYLSGEALKAHRAHREKLAAAKSKLTS